MPTKLKFDLTDMRFGRWLVLKRAEGYKSVHWLCKCDCGSTRAVKSYSLKSGKSTSCGCYQREVVARMGENTFNDLSGKRYGRLIVKKLKSKGDKTVWICRCDCGNEKSVMASSLVSGKTKSCGCYRKEFMREKMYNPDITDEERALSANRNLDSRNVEWRKSVFERDDYVCQRCGDDRGRNLVAHHKDGWNNNEERRFDIDNGVTTCDPCHNEFHSLYGWGDNTEEQWNQFMLGKRPKKPVSVSRPQYEKKMIGITFSYLNVIRRDGKAKDGHIMFLCRCVCGKKKRVQGSLLRSGGTKSCGCRKSELIKELRRNEKCQVA